jgi:PRC-barrel domain
MKRAALIAAAFITAPLPLLSQEAPRSGDREPSHIEMTDDRGDASSRRPQSEFGDRLADAIETLQSACVADIEAFCGEVTPGRGRLALCMRAHEDRLSRRCWSTLQRVGRNVERAVERSAESCWNEVRALCGEKDDIRQCIAQKKESLSPPCETIVTALGQRLQKVQDLTARVGMPVYGPDDKSVGQVAEVIRGPDGKVQSIEVDIGRLLGLGSKVVAISADKVERVAGIKVHLSDSELRSLPEAKKQ